MSTFNSRLETVEERNNKSEDKSEDDIQADGHKDNGIENTQKNHRRHVIYDQNV